MVLFRRLALAAFLALGLATGLSAVTHAQTAIPGEPDTERRTRYTASAQTGPFAVAFDVYGDGSDYQNWVEVYVNGVKVTQSGNWTMASVSGSFSTLARPITNATITFTAAQTGTVDIVGARRPRRVSQFQESQPVTAHAQNQVLTDLWMTMRERWDRIPRTILAPPGESIGPLPSAATRASGLFGFDPSGNPTILSPNVGFGTIVGPNTSVDGHVLCFNGTTGQLAKDCGPGIGTVLSVAVTLPNIFSVTGSPVTSTGTIAATLATQAANVVWAGPTTGSAAAPTFRALVGADLPNPSASTLGGVQSKAAITSQWLNSISTSGVPTSTQPAFTDISGVASAAQIPNPSASTLGGVQSYAAVANQWIRSISTSGVPASSQPTFGDLAGSIASAQMPNITGGDISCPAGSVVCTINSNAVTNAKLASMGAASFKCNPTVAGAAALDCTIQGLTARGAPDAANDKIPIFDNASNTIKYVTPNQIASAAVSGVPSVNGLSGALSIAAGSNVGVSSGVGTITVSGFPISIIAKTANYTALTTDCGSIISLGGSAQFTLTVGSAGGFPANCTIGIANIDAAPPTGRGKVMSINGVTYPANFLYPGQSFKITNVSGAWLPTGIPGRWKITSGTLNLYTNQSTGNDANDGLSSGNPKQTVSAAGYQIFNDFDFSASVGGGGSIVQINLLANDTTGIHWGPHSLVGDVQGQGLTIDGGGFSIKNNACTDDTIHLYFHSILKLQNIKILPCATGVGLHTERGAHVRLGLVSFGVAGSSSSSPGYIVVGPDSTVLANDIEVDFLGDAQYLVQCSGAGAMFDGGLAQFTFGSTLAWGTANVIANKGGVCDFSSATWSGSATGVRWLASLLGLVNSGTGTPNTFFPGNSNGSSNAGGVGN